MERTRRQRGLHPTIIEVAFVLMFLFLILSTLASITTSEARERSLPDLNLAELEEPGQDRGQTSLESLIISVGADGAVYLDDQPLSAGDLVAELENRRPPRVEVRGDVEATYGDVLQVFRACHAAGVRNLSLTFELPSS
ncbi:MAG: ExbD/TolR family protein [Opitutales bacterium]